MKVLDVIKSQDLDFTEVSEKDVLQATLSHFDEIAVREKIQLNDGTTFTWEFCDPNLLLAKMVEGSADLMGLYRDALLKHPCTEASPWSLIVGFDEYVPGNKLAQDNRRKVMNLSFNFLEVGEDALCRDATWMTPVALRASIIQQSRGWSTLLSRYLRLHLLGASGITGAGAPIVIDGQPRLLFAKLVNLLSDGDGLKQCLEWKGASGLKPCFRHFNVWRKDSDLAHRREGHVEIDCSDPRCFKVWRQADLNLCVDAIVETRRRRVAGEVTQSHLDSLQEAWGFTCSSTGLLADARLRGSFEVLEVARYDWVHSALADGLLSVDMWQYLRRCDERRPGTMRELNQHLQLPWQWPKMSCVDKYVLKRAFSEKFVASSTSADKLKCGASVLLTLYALVRNFVDQNAATLLALGLRAEHESFLAACKVVDTLLAVKTRTITMSDGASLLKKALTTHASLHRAAYGVEYIKPKHHWMFDVAETMQKDTFLFDCLVIERLHLRVRNAANHVLNTSRFERSVLATVMALQARMLNLGCVRRGLLQKTAHPLLPPGCDCKGTPTTCPAPSMLCECAAQSELALLVECLCRRQVCQCRRLYNWMASTCAKET